MAWGWELWTPRTPSALLCHLRTGKGGVRDVWGVCVVCSFRRAELETYRWLGAGSGSHLKR